MKKEDPFYLKDLLQYETRNTHFVKTEKVNSKVKKVRKIHAIILFDVLTHIQKVITECRLCIQTL